MKCIFLLLVLLSSCFAGPVKLEWNLNDWGRSTPPYAWWVWEQEEDGSLGYVGGIKYFWDGTQKINMTVEGEAGKVFVVQGSYSYDGSGRDNVFSPIDVTEKRTIIIPTPAITGTFAHKFIIQKSSNLSVWEAGHIFYFKEQLSNYVYLDIKMINGEFGCYWNFSNSSSLLYRWPIKGGFSATGSMGFYRLAREDAPILLPSVASFDYPITSNKFIEDPVSIKPTRPHQRIPKRPVLRPDFSKLKPKKPIPRHRK